MFARKDWVRVIDTTTHLALQPYSLVPHPHPFHLTLPAPAIFSTTYTTSQGIGT